MENQMIMTVSENSNIAKQFGKMRNNSEVVIKKDDTKYTFVKKNAVKVLYKECLGKWKKSNMFIMKFVMIDG